MEYTKEFKERDQLLQDLIERGLSVSDRAAALSFLTRVGYFRSGAYRYVLREFLPEGEIDARLRQFRSDRYIEGATFDHLVHMEAFDAKLARVCLDGVLDFEVRVRAAIAHALAERSVVAHTLVDCLDQHTCAQLAGEVSKFDAWMETCSAAIRAAAEDEDFIAHHLLKYPGHPVPIWAVTEALSFGSLPFLFELMQLEDRRTVAKEFGFLQPRPFAAVLRMMVDLRNVSAHGSRLFNRVFKRPLSLKLHETEGSWLDHITKEGFTSAPKPQQRIYIYASTLAYMLRSHGSGSNWHMTFKTQAKKLRVDLLNTDDELVVSREHSMGFPVGWEKLALWT